jgi:pimeloyl-ACP methyl ester carboxylesterase
MTTWVLLRGLVREQRHWGDFPALFQQEFPGENIVTLDLPGNGTLYHYDSPTRVEQMARFCRDELAHRGLKPPYRLLALSLGAMVAVSWCEQAPEDVEACVLINTSLRPFSPFYRRLRPQNYLRMLLALCSGVAAREQLILRLTSNHKDKQQAALPDWLAWQREFPVTRRNAARQLLAAMRYRAPQRKPDLPILVLGSSKDRLVDSRCSQQLAAQWGLNPSLHAAAGHDLPLDDGGWIASTVKVWLLSCNIAEQPVLLGSSGVAEVIIRPVKLAGKQ